MRLLLRGEGGFVMVLTGYVMVVVGLLCVRFLGLVVVGLHLWVVVELCVVVDAFGVLFSCAALLAALFVGVGVFIFTSS
jgi:hypothetical protein